MKKRKKNRTERARQKKQRRAAQRKGKGTISMTQQTTKGAQRIRGYMEKEAYADAVNAFADMVAEGNAPEECFGDIARAYFELGDYARAANWVTTTLTREPHNIAVRILLARICQRENRAADALAVYDQLIAAHAAELTSAQRAEIERRAGLDARLNPAETRKSHPHLTAFLGMGGGAAPQSAERPQFGEAGSAASAGGPAMRAEAPQPADAERMSFDAQKVAAEIMTQSIRPCEKLCALNAFAGVAYMDGDYAGAETLLTEALRLDPGSSETLRNMALLLHEMGDRDRAIRIASEMRCTDFLLLRALRS